MAKRYQEQVEVEAPDGQIEAFWWRGRRYGVKQILGRWRETGEWWAAEQASPWAGAETAEFVRIEAAGGARGGTFELARNLRTGAWSLHRVYD